MSQDYWNEASKQHVGPRTYFGQISVDIYPVRFSRGLPKVPFDPSQHPEEQKRFQVKLDGFCTDREGDDYAVTRKVLSKVDPEWDITDASVKALGGGNPHNKWARWTMVKSGRTYTSSTTNQIVEKDAFKFEAFYADEKACKAAQAAFYNRLAEEPEDEPLPMPPTEEEADKDRADNAQFLPTLWKLAQGDTDTFYAAIANQPQLAKLFDSNSPEVVAIVEGDRAQ